MGSTVQFLILDRSSILLFFFVGGRLETETENKNKKNWGLGLSDFGTIDEQKGSI
jgi:hypothetical protein